MGNLASNTINTSTTLDTNVINSAVNSFRQDAYISHKSEAVAVTELLAYYNQIEDCDINISVGQTLNDKTILTLQQANLSEVTNTFKTEVTNDISKQLQQANENFGLGNNVANDSLKISNFVQNSIYNTFAASLNVVSTSTDIAEESVKVYFNDVKCDGGSINIDTTNVINTANEIQVEQVIQAMVDNEEMTTILSKYNLQITQTNSMSTEFLLTLIFAGLAIALLPIVVNIISKIGGVEPPVPYILIFYSTLMIASAIVGIYMASANPIQWLYLFIVSVFAILFFLLVFFG